MGSPSVARENGPAVGQEAPDFTLPSQFGEDTTLSHLVAGRAALLVFYPFAFSGICASELSGIHDDLPRFANSRLTTVGVSCDPMFTQRAWADAEGFDVPLLSDFWPHGEVARAFGVFDDDAGFAVRGTFLVDTAMTVRWKLVNGPGDARDFTLALDALDALSGPDHPRSDGG